MCKAGPCGIRPVGEGAGQFVDDEWWAEGYYEAADGTVCSFNVTADEPDDPNESCQIYQILEDPCAVIAENRRYTLTFNALRLDIEETPTAYGALFYSLGGVNVPPVNDVTLASKEAVLTSPPWGEADYAGWEEITLTYTALSGAGSIGERLGVKLSVPVHAPWLDGYQVALDNVRVEWNWATDAWDPDPADGAEDVPIDVNLSWSPGLWAVDVNGHEVYFGTSWADVNSATTSTLVVYRGPNDVTGPDGNNRYSYDVLETLELGKSYYWRVDEVNEAYVGPPAAAPAANGRWKGDIWSFRTTGLAYNIYPADWAVGIPALNLLLRWTAGTDSNSHDVYFGTDKADVTDANTSNTALYPGVFRGNQPPADVNYALENLDVITTYYWRIDEVNAASATLVTGDVWRFTTGVFLIVDSFNSYVDKDALKAVWTVGHLAGNGAELFLETEPNLVRDGNSMRFAYRNTQYNAVGPVRYYVGSEAEAALPLEFGTNWTKGGAKALVLYFYGDAGNAQTGEYYADYHITNDQMYVAVEDGDTKVGVVKYDTEHDYDMNDIKEAEWHPWDISLQDPCLALADVNVANVAKVYIGFGGQKTGQMVPGAGEKSGNFDTVWFDDIRLYPPRCLPERTGIDNLHALGDFTEDCNTDYFDLEIMGRDWLMSGANVPPSVPETDAIAWYKFDEGSGGTTANSGTLGSTYDGVLVNGPVWTTEAHPNDGNALYFDGDDDGVYVADSPNMTGDNTVSFTAWVKREAEIPKWGGVIVMSRDEGEGSEGDNGTGVHTDTTATSALGYTWNNWEESYNWNSGLVLPLDKWVFVALTVEPTQGIMYLAEPNDADPNIYDLSSATNAWGHDGLSEYGDSRGGWDGTSSIYLGRDDPNKTDDATFPGKISDVRVYDYTLSRGNIMYLAGVSGTIYVPLDDWRADISGDDKVNFKDYRILADNWLEEHLWP